MTLWRACCLFRRYPAQQVHLVARSISYTPSVCTAEAQAVTVHKYPSTPKLAEKIADDRGCPLCRAGLQKFGYRDVLLLRQFLTPDGYLIGRRLTGVCPKMQRRITKTIRRSRKLGLLPNFELKNSPELSSS
ncbi:small ribosomal subunit protein bS18-like [Halichondria panicea]|uniref:small ribosomal subunit protein bS18-like n=1 Tax=Halichondria panicea TaxID=6063 RepID=UPI00312B5893